MKTKGIKIVYAFIVAFVALAFSTIFAVRANAESATHSAHCICGTTHANIGDHEGENLPGTWTAISSKEELTASAQTAGAYYLTSDVTLSSTYSPKDGTILCLNGHDINVRNASIRLGSNVEFTLTDCGDSTSWGSITGLNDEYSEKGAIELSYSATFNMYGGSIKDNHSEYGSAIYGSGEVNFYGGEIANNNAFYRENVEDDMWEAKGSAPIYNVSTFNMFGGKIYGNVGSGQNVYTHKVGVLMDVGTLNVHGGEIFDNTRHYDGYMGEQANGMIYCNEFTMTGGTITSPDVIAVSASQANVSGGSITGNSSKTYDRAGGALNVRGTAKISGGTLNGVKGDGNYAYGISFFGLENDSAGKLYLSGAPTITGETASLQICDADQNKIYFSNGLTDKDGEHYKEYYSGSTITFDEYITSWQRTNLDGKTIFVDFPSDYDHSANPLVAPAIPAKYALTQSASGLTVSNKDMTVQWFDEDGTTALTGSGYVSLAKYNTQIGSLPTPTAPSGMQFCGWLYKFSGDSAWSNAYATNYLKIYDNIQLKAVYVSNWTQKTDAEGTYYEINNAFDFYSLALEVSRKGGNSIYNSTDVRFCLTADIDLSQYCGEGVGNWVPIGDKHYDNYAIDFTFDGQNHTITGLYFNDSTVADKPSLFGCVDDGTIKNLKVKDAYVCGDNLVGIIASSIVSGNIINCHTIGGEVVANGFVGGIVGRNGGGNITECTNSAKVTVLGIARFGYMNSYIEASAGGGIVGINMVGTIDKCTNTGEIVAPTATSEENPGSLGVGGVCGANADTIQNSINTGDVTGGIGVGGVCGATKDLLNRVPTISSCLSAGSVTGAYAGGINGGDMDGNDPVENSYYLADTPVDGDESAKTQEQFESGEVAYLLSKSSSAWGQDLSVAGGMPTLTDDKELKVSCDSLSGEYGNTISVYFDLDGHGTAIAPITGKIVGDTITAPSDPEEIGWRFDGWFDSEEFTTPYDFTAPLNDSVTIYAKWTPLNARIGNVYYETLADAMAVVQDGETIVIDKSYQEVSSLNLIGADNRKVTIDLNGKIISFDGGIGMVVVAGFEVTITGSGQINAMVMFNETTKTVINGGTFKGVGFVDCDEIELNGGEFIGLTEVESEAFKNYGDSQVELFAHLFETDSMIVTFFYEEEQAEEGILSALGQKKAFSNDATTRDVSLILGSGEGTVFIGSVPSDTRIVNTYVVSINMGGILDNPTDQIVKEGETAIFPETYAPGHLFIGWFTDVDFTNAFSVDTGITADVTLYAKYADYEEDMGGVNDDITDLEEQQREAQEAIEDLQEKSDALEQALTNKADKSTVDAKLAELEQAIENARGVASSSDLTLKNDIMAQINLAKQDAVNTAGQSLTQSVGELNNAISTKADSATLNQKVGELSSAIVNAETVSATYADSKDTALKNALLGDIASAKTELAQLIADGDVATENALMAEIDDLRAQIDELKANGVGGGDEEVSSDKKLDMLIYAVIILGVIILVAIVVDVILISRKNKVVKNDPEPTPPVVPVFSAYKEEPTPVSNIARDEKVEEAIADDVKDLEEQSEENATESEENDDTDETAGDNDGEIAVALGSVNFSSIKPKTFTEKLIEADDSLKANYDAICDKLCSYKKVRKVVTQRFVRFTAGRVPVSKILIRGKSIKCYLALDPDKYEQSKYNHRNEGDKKRFAKVPFMMRVRSARSLKRTLSLIDEMMTERNITKK